MDPTALLNLVRDFGLAAVVVLFVLGQIVSKPSFDAMRKDWEAQLLREIERGEYYKAMAERMVAAQERSADVTEKALQLLSSARPTSG